METSATREALEKAQEFKLTLQSRSWIANTSKRIRASLLTEGIPDYATNVASRLNEMKVLRNYYRGGPTEFTRCTVRDIWKRHFGQDWRDWRDSETPRIKQKPQATWRQRPKQKQRWINVANGASPTAVKYCLENPAWTAATRDLIIAQLRAYPGNIGLSKAVEYLNRDHLLRSNYSRGGPEWRASTLASYLHVAIGKTYSALRAEVPTDKQEAEPVATPKRTAKFRLLNVYKDGTADVEIFKTVRQWVRETLPSTDPRVVNEVRKLLRVPKIRKTTPHIPWNEDLDAGDFDL